MSEVDLMFDTVGGDTLTHSPAVLCKGGRLVSVAGRLPEAACTAVGIECATTLTDASGVDLAGIGELPDSGYFRVHLDAVLALERAAEAQELNREGHTRGKIALEVRK